MLCANSLPYGTVELRSLIIFFLCHQDKCRSLDRKEGFNTFSSTLLILSPASILAPCSWWVVFLDKRRGSMPLSPLRCIKGCTIPRVQYPFGLVLDCLALFLDCICHVHHFSNWEQWTYVRLCTLGWILVWFTLLCNKFYFRKTFLIFF